MSPKSRGRKKPPKRGGVAGRAQRHGSVSDVFARQLRDARVLLAERDPLEAELWATRVVAGPRLEGMSAAQADLAIAGMLVEYAGNMRVPEAVALLRAVAAVGFPTQRAAATRNADALVARGVPEPPWAHRIGRVVPGAAWRQADAYGDVEIVTCTFRYEAQEHALLISVDRCSGPSVTEVLVVREVDKLRKAAARTDGPWSCYQEISLAEARERVEGPLRVTNASGVRWGTDDLGFLPLALARMRVLPDQPSVLRGYDASDRAAAVADFRASAQGRGLKDQQAARFWAEALAGYSGSLPGEHPARVGPRKLAEVLLSYVPATFELCAEHREALPQVARAWTAWAGECQGFGERDVTELMETLAEVLDTFDEAYDDPDVVPVRVYLRDVAETVTDACVLREVLHRRSVAVPQPGGRLDGHATFGLDASDPGQRAAVLRNEFAGCTSPPGMTHAELLVAVETVAAQLWDDDPPETWQAAKKLLSEGLPPHETLHELVALAGRGGGRLWSKAAGGT